MYMGEFLKKAQTTRDTVRFYIEEELLTPCKKGSWYWFTETDLADFENIKELQSLGLSIAGIKAVAHNHLEHCGTLKQWQENLLVVEGEQMKVQGEIEQLTERLAKLTSLAEELQQVIKNQQ